MEIEPILARRMEDGANPFKRHKYSGLTSRSIRRMNSSKKKMLESVPPMKSKPRGFSQ